MTQPLSIRALSDSRTTLDHVRSVVVQTQAANVVLVQGVDGAIQFPPTCPNCGLPAASKLRIQRGFVIFGRGDDETPDDTNISIDEFDVPFCAACIQRHRTELKPLSPWTPLKRILSQGEGFAGLFVMGIGLAFFKIALYPPKLIPFLMGCFPLLVGFWLVRSVWKKTRHMGLLQPTEVDLAVDFTPGLNLAFEPFWRAFLFRSETYAEAFRQANARHIWDPGCREAQLAAVKRSHRSFRSNLIIGTVVVAVLLYGLWDDFLSPYVMPYFQR